MKVLIADDHAIVRRGIIQVIKDEMPGTQLGEASRESEIIERIAKEPWDVLLLDIGLPARSGLEILRDVRVKKPNLPVLMLTVYGEEQYAQRAREYGASGYLTKDAAPELICKAIREVAAGRTFFTESPAIPPRSGDPNSPESKLSDREEQVLRLLASGLTAKEIAAQLNLSIKTVSTYRTRALSKLGLQRTGELIAYGVRRGLGA